MAELDGLPVVSDGELMALDVLGRLRRSRSATRDIFDRNLELTKPNRASWRDPLNHNSHNLCLRQNKMSVLGISCFFHPRRSGSQVVSLLPFWIFARAFSIDKQPWSELLKIWICHINRDDLSELYLSMDCRRVKLYPLGVSIVSMGDFNVCVHIVSLCKVSISAWIICSRV